MRPTTWIDVIEASYRVDQDEPAWLESILAPPSRCSIAGCSPPTP